MQTAADGNGTTHEGRDARGRFSPGNLGGTGNPFARRMAELRRILLEAVTDENMRIVAEQLVIRAMAGKLEAIKLLFQYVLGKPDKTVNPDTLDLQEIEQMQQAPGGDVVFDLSRNRVQPEPLMPVMRAALHVAADYQAGIMHDMLTADQESGGDGAAEAAAAPVARSRRQPPAPPVCATVSKR